MSPRQSNEAVRFWVKIGSGIFVVLLLTVWEHVLALGMERRLAAMRKEADRLTYENGHLQNQIHQWTSPSRLDDMAHKQYGMMPLDSAHVIGIHKP